MNDPEKKTDDPTAKPIGIPKVKVFVHNNQHTPLAVVLDTLRSVFHKDYANAAKIAQKAEAEGKALVDEFHFELAELRVEQGMEAPLQLATFLLIERQKEYAEMLKKKTKGSDKRAKEKTIADATQAVERAVKYPLEFTIER